MQRLYVPLDSREVTALLEMAQAALRRPHDQARLILRQEMQRAGYLPAEAGPSAQPREADHAAAGV